MSNLMHETAFAKHPTQEGVFVKHFFCKEDNSPINNLEVAVVPGFQISPHTHEDSSEFFYVARGSGEFLDDTVWKPVTEGDAFKAPKGMTHGIKNTGRETLVIFSTFSPATR